METRRQKHGAVFDSSHLHPVAALLLLSLSESEYTVEPTPSKNSSGLFTSFFPRVLHHARGPSEKLEKRLVTLQPARTCVPGVLVQASQCVFVKLLYNLCSSCRVFFVNLVFFVSLWVFFFRRTRVNARSDVWCELHNIATIASSCNMGQCCVPGCCRNYDNRPKVHTYSFQSDNTQKKLWLRAILWKDFMPTVYSKVKNSNIALSGVWIFVLRCDSFNCLKEIFFVHNDNTSTQRWRSMHLSWISTE